MASQSEITTRHDDYPKRHRWMLAALVWLSVYPVVTLSTYVTDPLDLPIWAQTFLTTILTVPLITFAVVPQAKSLIAVADPKA